MPIIKGSCQRENLELSTWLKMKEMKKEKALEVLPEDMEAQAKAELNKKAHSAVILCLGNKVMREVTGETTAAE
ncbi:hypothetical protein Tco_1304582, partial [Tanacetum coccineum]